jgi:hypothetical protein
MDPNLLFRHFWLLAAAVMLVNVVLWHRRLGELVADGRLEDSERRSFVRGAALVLVLPALGFEALTLAAHLPNPACLALLPPTSRAGAVLWVPVALGWVAALWWVWRGEGATTLARVALGRGPVGARTFTPRQVRFFVTVVVLGAAAGYVVNRQLMPDAASSSLCQEPARADHVARGTPLP